MRIAPDITLMKRALRQKCPRCDQGDLYKSGFSPVLRDKCESCGLDFSRNDSADGPAVFLIFVLGFLLVPAALILEFTVQPPVWVHLFLWSGLTVGLTLGTLRPLKSYIIALQYKHRPEDWS